MPIATLATLETAATRAIETHSTAAYDVAASYGQQFRNVQHMAWFHRAVMVELAATRATYSHLLQAVTPHPEEPRR